MVQYSSSNHGARPNEEVVCELGFRRRRYRAHRRRLESHPRGPLWNDQLTPLAPSYRSGEMEIAGILGSRRFSTFEEVIDNPDLIDAIMGMDNQAALFLWLGILWRKYEELTPHIRVQLENATKELAKDRRTDLDAYLTTVHSELRKTEDALMYYPTWCTDPNAVALKEKIDSLRAARSTLGILKRG